MKFEYRRGPRLGSLKLPERVVKTATLGSSLTQTSLADWRTNAEIRPTDSRHTDNREERNFFTTEEANRALEDVVLMYGGRIDAILAQDRELRARAEAQGQVEGQPLTLRFPNLTGQRVVRGNSIWFEARAEPLVEHVRRTVVSGLVRKRARTVVETKHYQDRFGSIRIIIKAKGWPERLHVLRHGDRINQADTMTKALSDLNGLVRLVLREEYPE
jgi:hypothetical protein